MSITTTDTQVLSNEPITLAEAKIQLGVTHNLDDARITRHILEAREEAEGITNRTLRLSVTHARTYDGWPSEMRFDSPPLESVVSVTYYDIDDVSQTLSSSNYVVRTPTDGRGDLTWSRAAGTTLPALTDRIDSVTVNYTTGYTSADAVPERAKGSILMLVSALYDQSELKESEAYRSTARRRLADIDWGIYE